MRIAAPALALALAGCASPAAPLKGVAAFTLRAPGTDGRVAAPGAVHETDGRPLAAGAGLSLDLLPESWILSFRADGTALPDDLEPARARAVVLDSWELAAGPKILESGGVRLDALAGGRAWLLRVADSGSGLPSDDLDHEVWVEPFAGLRAEAACGKGVSLRIRGDAGLGNSEGDRSWRGSAAGVFEVSRAVSLSFGWETSSVHHDRGAGVDRVVCDLYISGPFLALELRF